MQEIRFGVLGAARIVPHALLQPARGVEGVSVVTLGARDGARAAAFARRHDLARGVVGYEAVLADPEVNAVYIALPNALHAAWAQRALEAGKDVLCEKPLASNADEAARLVVAEQQSGRLLMEAFHWRYHPLAARVAALLADPAAGPLESIQARLRTPMLRRDDIRFDYALGGGATMDMGCYLVNMARVFAGAEPTVAWARATLMKPAVDKRMQARLLFPGGVVATIDCEMGAWRWPQVDLELRCARRTLRVANPILPQIYHHLLVEDESGRRRETCARTSTYLHQLRAFVHAVRSGTPVPSSASDGVRNMAVIDAIYLAAGLPRRGEGG